MASRSMTFEQFVADINRLAERDGWTKPGTPYCDAEAWRDAYNNGYKPKHAWREEKMAAGE